MGSLPFLALPVRRGRNAVALVALLVLTGLAFYVANTERATLGAGHWWVLVFPSLALRATFEWSSVKRLRVTAAGLLLVELKDSERWSQVPEGLRVST